MIALFPAREIFLQLGTFEIRWYGVLWALSFWVVWYLAPRLQKYRDISLSRDEWTRIIAYGAVGALIGGRVGYAVFYEPVYFSQHPFEIFSLAGGGMASHGGFIGVALGVWLATRKTSVSLWSLLDVLVVPIALTLALGRLGNWINQELFIGNFALLAAAKDILIAATCYLLLRGTSRVASRSVRPRTVGRGPAQKLFQSMRGVLAGPQAGEASAMTGPAGVVAIYFLLSYSILRFFVEFLRNDPWSEVWGLTRGQLYTLPLFVLSVWLLVCRVVKNR